MRKKDQNIVIILAQNEPGVLNKILSLCRRRRYNIEGLTAGKTNIPNVSQITLLFSGLKEGRVLHIVNQVNKVVEVIWVKAVSAKDVIDRELVILTVKDSRVSERLMKMSGHDINIREINNVDQQPVLEIVGEGGEVDHVLASLDLKKDVVKLVRSGRLALEL